MATYYVKNGGSDLDDGLSDATAFDTLEHAHSRSDVTTIRVHRDYSQVGFTPQKAGNAGDPIIFEPYGTGTTNKPTITGKKKLEGWTSIGDGLYRVTDSGFLDRVKFLLFDGELSTVATWPRNQTYNRITGGSGNATGTLSDSVNLSGKNFTGGEVVVKKLAWCIDTMNITNHSESTLTFEGGSSTYNLTVGWGYFVQNHRNCCTQVGDWCQEGKDIVMYFGANDPNEYTIYAPYLEGIYFNNRSNLQFHGFRFEMFNGGSDNSSTNPCFLTSVSQNLEFHDCEWEHMGNTVFYHLANNNSGFKIQGGTANNCLNIFYWNRYSASTPQFHIEDFYMENIGHIKGAGGNGSVSYSGIVFSSSTNGGLVRNVRLNNIGYNGISFNGYEFLVEKCRVENACVHKNDGGAFYSFGLGDEGKDYDITKRILRNNIAINCLGSNDGHATSFTQGFLIGAVEGYYLDDVVRKLTVENCIAINCRTGIKIHNNYDLTLRNNHFLLNQDCQTLWASDNLVTFPIRNIEYYGNVNYALSDQLVVRIDNKNTDEALFGDIDGNYYLKQGGGTIFNITKTGTGANTKNQTLSQWTAEYGHDENSHETPTLSLEYEIALNDTLDEILYPLERIRLDIDGNEVSQPFEIEPFSSKLLLDNLGPAEIIQPPIKEVYKNGFRYSQTDDSNPVIPAIEDVLQSASQMPSGYPSTDFVVWDEVMGAAKFMLDINRPTSTSSTHTGRVEHDTRYPNIRLTEEVWWSGSYYFDEESINDPLHEVLYQWHGYGGSPPISLRRGSSRLYLQIWLSSGTENQMWFDLGPDTPGVWHNFVSRIVFSDSINNGRVTMWKDGELAKCHSNITGEPWIIPTSGAGYYAEKASIGSNQSIIGGVSRLDFMGRNVYNYPNTNKYPKWGIYKPSWTSKYDSETGEILPGVFIEGDPLYVEPGNRLKVFWVKNINFETRVDDFSHLDIYKSLDTNGERPLEVPEWWVEEYTIVVTVIGSGSVSGSGTYEDGQGVDLLATPDTGWSFLHWSDIDGIYLDNPLSFISEGNRSLEAIFVEDIPPVEEYNVTLIAGTGGTVSGGGAYEDGEQATATATPDSGWHFVRWSNDVTDNPYTFTVTGDATLQAIFAQDEPVPGVIIVKGKFRIV